MQGLRAADAKREFGLSYRMPAPSMSDNLYCFTTLTTGESDMHGAKGGMVATVVPAVTKMTHLGLSLMNQADASLPTTTLLKGWLEALDKKTSFRGLNYPRRLHHACSGPAWLVAASK
jgi:hypothetical protein